MQRSSEISLLLHTGRFDSNFSSIFIIKCLERKWALSDSDFRGCVVFFLKISQLSGVGSLNLWSQNDIISNDLNEYLESTSFLNTLVNPKSLEIKSSDLWLWHHENKWFQIDQKFYWNRFACNFVCWRRKYGIWKKCQIFWWLPMHTVISGSVLV